MKSSSYKKTKASEQASSLAQCTADEVQARQARCRAEIGRKLRSARERKYLSVEQLANQTLVHTRFIQAFEAGREPDLADTYSKGYLKLLAEGLDLPAADLIALFEEGRANNLQSVQTADAHDGAPRSNYGANLMSARAKPLANVSSQLRQICSEGLGALVSVGAEASRLVKKKPHNQVGVSSAKRTMASSARRGSVATENGELQAGTSVSQRPTAIMKSGSSWHSNAWSPTSWFGLVNGAVVGAVVVGVIVAASFQLDDGPGSQVTESEAIESVAPLGELASSAVVADTGSELSPLNGDERRAALAMFDQSSTDQSSTAPVEQEVQTQASEETPQVASVNQSQPTYNDTRLTAIQTAPDASADLQSRVTSVISVGSVAEHQRAASHTPYPELNDTYEPVGPGAEYMIAQHPAQDRLVISVYEDSWVDVRDAEGVRLYRALAKAGRRIDLSGKLPFSLHVGNAPGLGLELNGEFIPIEGYRADNSARLTLATTR